MPSINWGNLARQAGDAANPFNGRTDYDVFSDLSVSGGTRNPLNSTSRGINFGIGQQAPARPAAQDGQVANSGKAPGTGENNNGVLGTSNYASGSGGGADPDLEMARFNIEQGINQGNDALGRFGRQEQNALANIGGQFQSAYDRLTGQRQLAQRDFNTGRDQQLQDYESARSGVNANTRNLLMGARRLLGSQGAGGGSADLFAAPLAAQQEGNNANAQVKQTNERNLGALTTSFEDNERKLNQGFNDLTMQRQQSEQGVRSQFEQQRADVLSQIAGLRGQQAIMGGGNAQQAMAAASPYSSRIQSILANIDRLSVNAAPIREQQIQLSRPDLAQYNLGRFDAPAQAMQDPTLGTPNYNALVGLPEEQRRDLGY